MLEVKDELIIKRTYKAPKSLVFKAWAEAERLEQWWGPLDFSLEVITLDFQPQGIFHYCFESPDGLKMWGKFVYLEIEQNTKIIFTNSFADENENIIRAPFSNTWPLEIQNTITFEEADGETTMILRGFPFNATEDEINTFNENLENMLLGFNGTFDRLEDYLLKN